jgi:hypothetical protein
MKKYILIAFVLLITLDVGLYFKSIYDGYVWEQEIEERSKVEMWKDSGTPSTILFKKNVKWGGFEDGSGPSLEHENWIVLGKSDLTIDELYKWQRGKLLTLAYSRAQGAMLIDPVTKKSVRLLNMKSDHPIDGYLKQELDKPEACSTQGMVEAYDRSIDLWELELKRLDENILSRKYFKGEIRDKYLKLQQARENYKKLLYRVGGLSRYFAPGGGTILRIESAGSAYEITKVLALQSMQMAQYAEDFDKSGDAE